MMVCSLLGVFMPWVLPNVDILDIFPEISKIKEFPTYDEVNYGCKRKLSEGDRV